MKRNYKNIYILGVLALLLISCSLVKTIPVDKVTQSSSTHLKSRDLVHPVQIHTPKLIYCTVETGYVQGQVNLRSGAGLTFDVLDVLEEGGRLEVLTIGDWLNVSTADELTGYIKSKYCRIGE